MNKSIFECESYKSYVNDWLDQQSGRGQRSALATALKVQPAFVTQVLKGESNFSLEHTEVLNRYLGHGEAEAEFLYLLVQWERAGSENLRAYFHKSIEAIRAKRRVLKERLQIKEGMSELDRTRYYSAWYFTATHILLTIPAFQTRAAVGKKLNLSPAKTAEILDFLVATGLVEQTGDRYTVTNARIHLGNDSPELLKHHTNWRMRGVLALEHEQAQHLHYSSVVSLSHEDVTEIRETLVKAIEHVKARVRPSKEEELYAFCLDWFGV